MGSCKSNYGNQNPSFSSFEELINWAKEEYNATNFPNYNYSNIESFEEIVDWRK
jgi:hypothetical protein